MARRFGVRMDQVFKALMSGAGIRWGAEKDLQFVWPEVENPILAAARARKGSSKRSLKASTAVSNG
jgi:hypothetical protein